MRSTRTHGRPLIVDGQIGPVTQALLQEPRCGVADHVRGLEANWPTACREDLTFAPLFARLAPLSPEQTMSAFRAACASWGKDVQLQITLAQDLGQNAHIWARAAPLRGSTLAWSYLPQNSCAAHLEQRYNTAVNWSQTYLQGVGAHELGHAVGLQHSRDPRALMYPTARREIYLPHAVDIEAMLRLGYDRRTTDPEPEPPTPGVRVEGFIRINSWRYELRPARANGGGTDWT